MKLDFKKFSKVSEDKHSTTLRHPDGHEVRIAHAALNPKMRSQLAEIKMYDGGGVNADGSTATDRGPKIDPEKAKAFVAGVNNKPVAKESYNPDNMGRTPNSRKYDMDTPSFANGGQVQGKPLRFANGGGPGLPPPGTNGTDIQYPPENANPDLFGVPASSSSDGQALAASAPPQASQQPPASIPVASDPTQAMAGVAPDAAAPPTNAGAQPAAPSDPFGTGIAAKTYQEGLNEQIAGAQGMAGALSKQAGAEMAAHDAARAVEAKALKTYNDKVDLLEGHRQDLNDAIEGYHIDPNKYLNERGLGTKVAQTIGVFLGGLGGAGTKNPAMEYIQGQINRDIDAQKAELGKKQNMLSENLRQFGNLRDATEMTRIQTNDMLIHQLEKARLSAQGDIAKYRLTTQIGELKANSASQLGQMAARQTIMSGFKDGHVNPGAVVNFMVPEPQRAAANKELTEMMGMKKAMNNALNAYDKLAAIPNSFRLMHPVEYRQMREKMLSTLTPELAVATANRFTSEDNKILGGVWPTAFSKGNPDAEGRRRLADTFTNKMNSSLLQTYGITPDSLPGGNAAMPIQRVPNSLQRSK